jgi:hypothetical protein
VTAASGVESARLKIWFLGSIPIARCSVTKITHLLDGGFQIRRESTESWERCSPLQPSQVSLGRHKRLPRRNDVDPQSLQDAERCDRHSRARAFMLGSHSGRGVIPETGQQTRKQPRLNLPNIAQPETGKPHENHRFGSFRAELKQSAGWRFESSPVHQTPRKMKILTLRGF